MRQNEIVVGGRYEDAHGRQRTVLKRMPGDWPDEVRFLDHDKATVRVCVLKSFASWAKRRVETPDER